MSARNSSADEGKRWGRIAGELCCISLVQTVEAAEQKETHDKCPIFLSRSYTSVPEALQLLEKLEDAARERPDLVNPVIEKFLDQLPSLS